jgi:hypothetical protein
VTGVKRSFIYQIILEVAISQEHIFAKEHEAAASCSNYIISIVGNTILRPFYDKSRPHSATYA